MIPKYPSASAPIINLLSVDMAQAKDSFVSAELRHHDAQNQTIIASDTSCTDRVRYVHAFERKHQMG